MPQYNRRELDARAREGMLKHWYRTGNYDVIRDFISSILAVISVLVILVGTYISLSEIKKHR